MTSHIGPHFTGPFRRVRAWLRYTPPAEIAAAFTGVAVVTLGAAALVFLYLIERS